MPSVLQHVCQCARRPPGTDDGAKRHVAVSSTKTGSRRDVRVIDNLAPSMSLRPYIRPGHRDARTMWRALSIRMTSLMPHARTRLCVAIATRSVRGSAPRVIVESFDGTRRSPPVRFERRCPVRQDSWRRLRRRCRHWRVLRAYVAVVRHDWPGLAICGVQRAYRDVLQHTQLRMRWRSGSFLVSPARERGHAERCVFRGVRCLHRKHCAARNCRSEIRFLTVESPRSSRERVPMPATRRSGRCALPHGTTHA
ncbi:hypothetical protein FEP08_04675 [Burkholderia multivorans]|jgi:hypothetical protein|nr:hypothetical protein [Burkholderia multivorans]